MTQANFKNPIYQHILVLAILMSVLSPVLAFVSGYFNLREQLDTQASRQAQLAAQVLAKYGENESLALFFPHLQISRSADGLWQLHEAQSSLSIAASAPVQAGERELGQLSLQASLYPILLNSGLILILSLSLVAILWYLLRIWEQAMRTAHSSISLEKLRESPDWIAQEEEHQRLLREHDAHLAAIKAHTAQGKANSQEYQEMTRMMNERALETQSYLEIVRKMKVEWDENVIKITQGMHQQELALQQEKAARQAAQEANVAKTRLLASISHDLRIPLNGILGMNALLLDSGLDAQQAEFAEAIQHSANTLLHLADGVLDYARIEVDDLVLNSAAFSPVHLLESCLDMLAPRARQKSISLTCTVDAQVAPLMVGDAPRLQQILMNLGSNAVKFTADGVVQFSLRCVAQEESKQRLRFEVQDSGCGMSPTQQEQLFVDTSLHDGRGLGLSICSRLAKLMQAELGVQSETDVGSRFWLELDLPLSAQPTSDPWQAARLLQSHLQGRRVLLVHAHEQESAAICSMLEAIGIAVARVEQAVAALQIFQRDHDFAVAIVAAHLPDMEGNALAVAFSAVAPDLKLVLMADPVYLRKVASDPDFANFHAHLPLPVKAGKMFDALLRARGIAQSAATEPPVQSRLASELRVQAKLLLVEDNQINQKLGLIQLRKLGYQVELAGNGQQAVSAWQLGQFDLILMDCEMPVMNGFAATAAIRLQEAQEGRHPVHIVAMTANAMAGDRERCLAAGMDDYISKPISADSLQQVIARHLPHRGVGQAVVTRVGDEAAAVDLSLLTDICNGDHATIFAFLDQYVLASDTLLSKMGAAILAKQLPQLRALNHELTGTSANLGVRLMHILNNAMSQACSEEDFDRAAYLYTQMQEAMVAVREFVHNRG